MLAGLVQSRWAFRLLIALPALAMLSRYAMSGGGMGLLLEASGEWSARMLIATLAVTPLRLLIVRLLPHGQGAAMWLHKRRRDLGLAAFLYALLHVGTYLVRQSNINVILYDLPYKEYLAGWIGLAAMVLPALTSSERAVHAMGTVWKPVQRLTYVAIVSVYLHWLWMKLDHWPAYLHILPLVLLEAYRVWHNFARPSGQRH
jgi:sulfoxide reductase heme-binding subunit YedZ